MRGHAVPSWDGYLDFRSRALQRMAALAGVRFVRLDGVVACVGADPSTRGAVVVTSAVPESRLDEVLAYGVPHWIALLPAAAPLAAAVAARGWSAQEERTAMALPDLRHLEVPALPPEVEVRPVAVRQNAEGFPLSEALGLALSYASPTTPSERDLALEAQLVRRLPEIRFFAAVGPDGSLLSTAGSRVVDRAALVASVATHPAARGRGIGTAMTAIALRAAADAGATAAYLDARGEATQMYRRLGFQALGPVRWCERPAS